VQRLFLPFGFVCGAMILLPVLNLFCATYQCRLPDVNVFASVYLLKADTLHTADDVANLRHRNFYWFCLVCDY